jgi:hypothetical protein
MPGVEVVDIFKAMKDAGMIMVSEKALVSAHGSGALLSAAGVRPGMPSAIRRVSGMKLPLFPSLNVNEIIEIFTAQDADSGSNATTWCTAAPVAGNLRIAQIVSVFGKYKMQTNTIVAPEVGERLNYADVDRQVINDFKFDPVMNPFMPDVVSRAGNINTTLGKELIQFGLSAERAFQRVDYTGNITTASASTYKGFIKEYDGLARLIKTGYADAVSSAVAPAADSIVLTYGATLSSTIVTTLSDLIRSLRMTAEMVGKPNVVWEIQINFRMWHALVDLWACNYAIARCSTSDNAAGTVDLGRISQLRDEMARGKYLLVDGEPIPVNTNAGVPVTDGATTNEFISDIFVVPLYDPDSALGRVRDGVEWLTYHEYFPFDNSHLQELMREGWSDLEVMNNGLYLKGASYGTDSFCRALVFAAKVRLKLDYPFLAGRIDDVTFLNSNPIGTPYQDESDYKGGGDDAR